MYTKNGLPCYESDCSDYLNLQDVHDGVEPISVPQRSGYTFDGYYNSQNVQLINGNGYFIENVTNAYLSSVSGNETRIAQWTPNEYTISFDSNGGNGGQSSSRLATFDDDMPSITCPTRSGYTFAGYYDISDATGGTQYYTASCSSARTWDKTSGQTLYARLSVRIFDLMHETYPELDENVLRACNPEMARVIRALLIANMSDDDVHDINEIAERVAKTLNDMSSLDKNAQNSAKIQCNNDIKRAMAIVENNIAINQNLYSAIYELYRGKVPAQFVFESNQNTK